MKNAANAEEWYLSVVSGARKGPAASIARGAFAAAEPVYAAAVHARNFLYTRRILKAAHARRPVVSVGNVTTGGTGKTPMVAWLTGQLREAGRKPAVLLRGYRSSGGISDEEALLREWVAPSPVVAQADRFAASEQIVADHPDVDVFVLDDGHQHRQLARYFSIVLVDATSPFGFGHVLPRGLLREPMRGFRRANAVVITRVDLVDGSTVASIEKRVRAEYRDVPMFRCKFVHDELIDAAGNAMPIEELRGKRVFAFCGIGNPDAFFAQLRTHVGEVVGTRRFPDHHAYRPEELIALLADAASAGAERVLSTEKDWVKLAPLVQRLPADPPLLRIGLKVEIEEGKGSQLVQLVMAGIRVGDELLGWRTVK